ncbi:MAG: dCTP deaminase [Cyanobacteriota bacterium]|nr:dCTP deaminase [Cyanobacteriota bacterium]
MLGYRKPALTIYLSDYREKLVMRLSSTDLRKLIAKNHLKILGNEQLQFDPDTQIRPSSIDIHISNKFCKLKITKDKEYLDILDIQKAREYNSNLNLLYQKNELSSSEYIELKPNEAVLTESLECIEVPSFLSGALKGRSSFARLGISIHCTGDFINPGYRGHMPIQIVNHNSVPIRIYPFLKMAQLVFTMLSSEPDIDYQKLPDTIYKQETGNVGGLSLWFRDQEVEKVALRISGKQFDRRTKEMIEDMLIRSEKRTLKQMEEYLKRAKVWEPKQIEEKIKRYQPKDVERDKKMRIFFWLFTLVSGANFSVLIPEAVKAVNTANFHEPTFWISVTIFIFSSTILWITFDIKFIGL